MKKLILFFVVVLIVGCSKDDNGASRNSDPIIGNWRLTTDNNDSIMGYNFNENGTGELIDGDIFPMRWSNENDNFDSTTQSYIIK